jgi:enoyl-CoA hydratase/carnithine racemase
MALILLEKSDGVATITLNRPEAMNALSSALRAEFCSACQDVRDDKTIHALILKSWENPALVRPMIGMVPQTRFSL